MLGLGRGRWTVFQKHILIRRNKLSLYRRHVCSCNLCVRATSRQHECARAEKNCFQPQLRVCFFNFQLKVIEELAKMLLTLSELHTYSKNYQEMAEVTRRQSSEYLFRVRANFGTRTFGSSSIALSWKTEKLLEIPAEFRILGFPAYLFTINSD